MGNTALKNTNLGDTASRGPDIFYVYPEDLKVEENKNSKLYDRRIEMELDEGMVLSILEKGVIEPLIVRKDGRDVYVTDGKQRRAHAIEANKRLVADGAGRKKVPITLRQDKNEVATFEVMVTTNLVRRDDDVVTCAENVHRYMTEFGRSVEDAAKMCGRTAITIQNWLKIMDLAPEVRSAIRRGAISYHDAVNSLSDVKREEQTEALDRMLASAPATTRKSKRGVGGAEQDHNASKKASPISRLRKIFRSKDAMAALGKKERMLVEWVYSQRTMGDLMAALPELAEVLSRTKAKKTRKSKASKSKDRPKDHPTPRVASVTR